MAIPALPHWHVRQDMLDEMGGALGQGRDRVVLWLAPGSLGRPSQLARAGSMTTGLRLTLWETRWMKRADLTVRFL